MSNNSTRARLARNILPWLLAGCFGIVGALVAPLFSESLNDIQVRFLSRQEATSRLVGAVLGGLLGFALGLVLAKLVDRIDSWLLQNGSALLLGVYSVTVVIGLVLIFLPPAKEWGWGTLNLMSVPLLLCFVIALHETGHALASWLLGLRVFRVQLGVGPTLIARDIGAMTLQLNAFPTIGCVRSGHRTVHFARIRQFLMVLAGPLANLTMLGVIFSLVTPDELLIRATQTTTRLALLPLLVALNVLTLAGSVFPRAAKIGDMALRSDGLQLCTIPFCREATIRQWVAAYFAMEGDECVRHRDYPAAQLWYERGLEHSPDDMPNSYGIAYLLLAQRRPGDARKQFLRLLAAPALAAGMRPIIGDCIATIDLELLQQGRSSDAAGASGQQQAWAQSLLQEADEYTQEALARVRVCKHLEPSFKGTRGCVLIELGKIDEGVALLEETLPRLQEPSHKAWTKSYLALAAFRRHEPDEARRLLDEARDLDADCHVLEAINREVTQRETDASPVKTT